MTFRMQMFSLAAIAAAALMTVSASASAQAPAAGMMGKINMAQMERMMAGWPAASREAAMFMTNKYGPPAAMTSEMAMWGKTGPWKRTIVYSVEHPHEFPAHHTDVMQQWVDYQAYASDGGEWRPSPRSRPFESAFGGRLSTALNPLVQIGLSASRFQQEGLGSSRFNLFAAAYRRIFARALRPASSAARATFGGPSERRGRRRTDKQPPPSPASG